VRSGADGTNEGRYVIYRTKADANFGLTWLDESDVRRMLAQADVKLGEPDTNEVRVAKEGVKQVELEEIQMTQAMKHVVWRRQWSWIVSLFVVPSQTNATAANAPTSALGRIRPVPIGILVLVLCGGSILALRALTKKRKSK
jgi:hypothetical protein